MAVARILGGMRSFKSRSRVSREEDNGVNQRATTHLLRPRRGKECVRDGRKEASGRAYSSVKGGVLGNASLRYPEEKSADGDGFPKPLSKEGEQESGGTRSTKRSRSHLTTCSS